MRDTFLGLNQKKVLELKNKYLDGKGESFIKTEDLILIRRIQDFMNSSKSVQVILDGYIYSWVHYETVQEDLPMIFPSVVSLKKRIEKLKKLKILINKDYTVTKNMAGENKDFLTPGKYSVIRLSKECKSLFDFSEHKQGVYHEGVKGQHHEGVKGQHHEGVNKEYLDYNTLKKNTKIDSQQNDNTTVGKEKIKLKAKIDEYKTLISKATGEEKAKIDLVLKPYVYMPILDQLLEKIKASKYLLGEKEQKPNLRIFAYKTNEIIAGMYDDFENKRTVETKKTKTKNFNPDNPYDTRTPEQIEKDRREQEEFERAIGIL